MKPLRAPFPYFGGKFWLTPLVWQWLGADVGRYIEPFAGGMAMLLGRPGPVNRPRFHEVVNDAYGHIANVWRAIKSQPEAVWDQCQDPLHEADLHARTKYLISAEKTLRESLMSDVEFCDPKLAAWWLWCQGASIKASETARANRCIPCASAQGVFSNYFGQHFLQRISNRLQSVQILCGDFARPLTDCYTLSANLGPVGVYLDPPYAIGSTEVYGTLDHASIWDRTAEWAISNCNKDRLRIVVSGYQGSPKTQEMEEAGFVRFNLKANGTNAKTGNHLLEACWVSPACLPLQKQGNLFEEVAL